MDDTADPRLEHRSLPRASSVVVHYFATVGTFNDKDKADGNKLIYQSEVDGTNASTWEALKLRTTEHGKKRPLIVVYD